MNGLQATCSNRLPNTIPKHESARVLVARYSNKKGSTGPSGTPPLGVFFFSQNFKVQNLRTYKFSAMIQFILPASSSAWSAPRVGTPKELPLATLRGEPPRVVDAPRRYGVNWAGFAPVRAQTILRKKFAHSLGYSTKYDLTSFSSCPSDFLEVSVGILFKKIKFL